MKTYKSIICVLVTLFLTACQAPVIAPDVAPIENTPSPTTMASPEPIRYDAAEPFASFDELLQAINNKNMAIRKPSVSSVEGYAGRDGLFTFNWWELPDTLEFKATAEMTLDDCKEDVEIYFAFLRSNYGAYEYFGGDEVFLKAKSEILAELEMMERISAQNLEVIMRKHLGFIKDGHFYLNGKHMGGEIYTFVSADEEFHKTDGGRYINEDGLLLDSMEGYEDCLKLSVTSDGQLVYYPVIYSAVNPRKLTAHYTDGSSQELFFQQTNKPVAPFNEMVGLKTNQNVPVLYSRAMGFDNANNDKYKGKAFLEYAEELRDEPVLIVDLRYNGGGNGILPLKWFDMYTGGGVTTNHIDIAVWDDDFFAEDNTPDNLTYTPPEDIEKYMETEKTKENVYLRFSRPDEFIESEPLMIILTSRDTASAAEIFVDAARNVGNTIIIGENTYGCLISSLTYGFNLPNSAIYFSFGNDVRVFPEGYFEEFTGFEPDFWVFGDAEEAAINLLKNFGVIS